MNRPLDTTCPICHGAGIIFKNDKAVVCKCMDRLKYTNLVKRTGMGQRMFYNKFENFDFRYYSKENSVKTEDINKRIGQKTHFELAEETFKKAKNFVEHCVKNTAKQGLIIMGKPGTGKTFIACSIANKLLKAHKEFSFIVVPDLLEQIKQSYEKKEVENPMPEIKEAPILILDDLAAHTYTDWVKNQLFCLINYRVNNMLPTVITTNLTYEILTELLGERISSRILELCDYCYLETDNIRQTKILQGKTSLRDMTVDKFGNYEERPHRTPSITFSPEKTTEIKEDFNKLTLRQKQQKKQQQKKEQPQQQKYQPLKNNESSSFQVKKPENYMEQLKTMEIDPSIKIRH